MKKVWQIIEKALLTGWAEDEWFAIGSSLDLNLWTDSDGAWRASLYPVIGGKTKTEQFIRLV